VIPRLHFLRASLTDRCLCVRARIKSAEGDRKASKETAGAKIEGNKRRIATLREGNKDLVAQLRVLKNPGKQKYGAGVSMKAVNVMDEKVCGLIKKHNHVRAEALRKEKELLQLQKEMCVVFSLDCVQHCCSSTSVGNGVAGNAAEKLLRTCSICTLAQTNKCVCMMVWASFLGWW
jgi:hypothetical protein